MNYKFMLIPPLEIFITVAIAISKIDRFKIGHHHTMTRCSAKTKDGKRCKIQAVASCNGLCSVHHKAEQKLEKQPDPEPEIEEMEEVEESEEIEGSEEVDVNEVASRYEAHIYQLVNRIASLELEISTQKQTISQMTTGEEIESKLKKVSTKKGRKYVWTEPRIQEKAKWLYYKDHKKDEKILEGIYNMLSPAGVVYNVPVKVDGVIQAKPFIPWQYVKKICDDKFALMDPVEKQKFLQQAIEMLG